METDSQFDDNIRSHLDIWTRRERGRLIAGLVKRLGHHNLALAEDVAQDALLSALLVWQYQGPPKKPTAWLTRVAHNKALDRLRHDQRNQSLNGESDKLEDSANQFEIELISDPQLRLIFMCCNSKIVGVDLLALTLRIVSGFTAREIAGVFLCTESAMSQRLSRCKKKIKPLKNLIVETPSVQDIESGLNTVLKTIYLIFSVGYAPRCGTKLIRRDVALEALRLARELADKNITDSSEPDALAALLCFQASRLYAREDSNGLPILLMNQNRQNWDHSLINTGVLYLRKSMKGKKVTRYHLEAGIASLYATSLSWRHIDWNTIVEHYERLEKIIDSSVVSVNASVAKAFAGYPEDAIIELDNHSSKSMLSNYAPYHLARAEVLKMLGRKSDANKSYDNAVSCQASKPLTEFIENRISLNL